MIIFETNPKSLTKLYKIYNLNVAYFITRNYVEI